MNDDVRTIAVYCEGREGQDGQAGRHKRKRVARLHLTHDYSPRSAPPLWVAMPWKRDRSTRSAYVALTGEKLPAVGEPIPGWVDEALPLLAKAHAQSPHVMEFMDEGGRPITEPEFKPRFVGGAWSGHYIKLTLQCPACRFQVRLPGPKATRVLDTLDGMVALVDLAAKVQ